MDILYRCVLKPILFKIDPDKIHDLFITIGELSGRYSILRWLFGFFYDYNGPDISKTVDGIMYRTPVLLSAGFDPDGRLTQILPSFSFGGEEIGSITARPCEGNPLPRMKRLVRDKSIVVYKGLRNKGVDVLIKKLSRTSRARDFIIGISIARTNDENACSDEGILDYTESFQKLIDADAGDYYVMNISCPNAYKGESFTDPKLLSQLLSRIREVRCSKPVYLKMPINIHWEQFVELADIADKNNIHGLIIGNVNKDYTSLMHPEEAPKEFRGGLSGAPCKALSNELIRKTREHYGSRFTIIGVGGIMTPEDAMEKFAAGADLVQLISGMIFEGPGLVKRICIHYEQTR